MWPTKSSSAANAWLKSMVRTTDHGLEPIRPNTSSVAKTATQNAGTIRRRRLRA